jgi:NAD(P)-dependent dehydrogenase (short-subunit alcohol dehydrogenase family)
VTTSGRLEGEVAIVTGSTSGLGKVTAAVLAAEGASVIVTGRNRERGEAVVAGIAACGGRAAFVAADLAAGDAAERLVDETVAAFGALTVVVNNAVSPQAIADDTDIVALSRHTLEAMLQVNLVAPLLLCKAAIPAMLRTGHGSIVNVSSIAASTGVTGLTAYSASKGGMTSVTRTIVADYGRRGIRCNTVEAGYIIHEGRDAGMTEERRRKLEGRQITRLSYPEDVARAIAFLASHDAETITGVTLPVDGGATAVRRVSSSG